MFVWGITIVCLLFDIGSLIAIYFRNQLPDLLVESICKGYLATLVLEAICGMAYITADVYAQSRRGKIVTSIFILAGIIGTVLVFYLPVYISTPKPNVAFTYGPSTIVTYILCIGSMIGMALILLVRKDRIHPKRREAVFAWITFWLIAAFIQFKFPELLVVGFASMIGVLVIYLRLENPEMNIESESGLFNMNAFLLYLRQLCIRNDDVSVVCVEIQNEEFTTNESMYQRQDSIKREIIEYIKTIPRALIFYNSDKEFYFIFKKEEDAKNAIEMLKWRFKHSWGKESMRFLKMEWLYLLRTSNVGRAEDVLRIFQFVEEKYASSVNEDGIIIDEKMVEQMYDERETEDEIISALNEGRVEVFYQPIYSVERKKFTSAEALVRIRDEKGNLIPPGKFIHVAETRGLINRLGEEVFRQACKFVKSGEPQKYGVDHIEINLSVVQCANEHLADEFISIMNQYHVDPKGLVLEITESASVNEKNILLRNMEALRDYGIEFALDDFGTGQSNLNYIVEMPVDIVKFDSTMIRAYFENGTAKHVMNAAIHMIQGMDLAIVAEGIEEKEQLVAMEEFGIEFIQGYYFSKPVDRASFIKFVKQNNA